MNCFFAAWAVCMALLGSLCFLLASFLDAFCEVVCEILDKSSARREVELTMKTGVRGSYNAYDHRLKALVVQAGDLSLFREVKDSTGRSWIKRGYKLPKTLELLNDDRAELIIKLKNGENELAIANAKLELFEMKQEVFGWSPKWQRVPDGDKKQRILGKITDCLGVLSISECLKILEISASRFSDWTRRANGSCTADDQSSCPISRPSSLTPIEVIAMKEMVEAKEYAHFPIGSLAKFAKRAKKIYASAATWSKKIRDNGWRRPRKRLYPLPPKQGIRATAPNQIFHIDVTIFKLVDGTKAYVHTVIDNFSRKILACKVSASIAALNTQEILKAAIESAVAAGYTGIIDVFSDSGCENVNDVIKDLFASNDLIKHILAKIDVSFSNSMIERFFLSAKHNYLFLQNLMSLDVLRKHLEFYILEHNGKIPHSAFNGATPNEIYDGTWTDLQVEELKRLHQEAVRARIASNKKLTCNDCHFSVVS